MTSVKILELQRLVEAEALQSCVLKVKCASAKKKVDDVGRRMNSTKNATKSLMKLQEEALKKYDALVPFIEHKTKLTEELDSLKEKLKEAEKAHCKEFEEIEQALELTDGDQQIKYYCEIEDIEKSAETAETNHKNDFRLKSKEIQELKEEMKQKEKSYSKEISAIKKKNHTELEELRNQVTKLQQQRSLRAISNADLITNKLQAVRRDYEEKIQAKLREVEESTEELSALKEELQKSRENLKHHEQLNEARDLSKAK